MLHLIISLFGVIKSSTEKKKYSTNFPYHKELIPFLDFLIVHRAIENYRVKKVNKKLIFELIFLYSRDYKGLVYDVTMFSFKNFQCHCKVSQLKKLYLFPNYKYRNLNILYLIYTKKGLMILPDALNQNLGGILVCKIQFY